MASPAEAVLVELPLAIPFEASLPTLDAIVAPQFAKQAGCLCLKIGRKLEVDPEGHWAMILIIWECAESRERFLETADVQRLDETIPGLIRGLMTVTRYQFIPGDELVDYIPYTQFRKYQIHAISSTTKPLDSWLEQATGSNLLSACVEECQKNVGRKICKPDCFHTAEGLILVALCGLSAESVRERPVLSAEAELRTMFTVEWVSSNSTRA